MAPFNDIMRFEDRALDYKPRAQVDAETVRLADMRSLAQALTEISGGDPDPRLASLAIEKATVLQSANDLMSLARMQIPATQRAAALAAATDGIANRNWAVPTGNRATSFAEIGELITPAPEFDAVRQNLTQAFDAEVARGPEAARDVARYTLPKGPEPAMPAWMQAERRTEALKAEQMQKAGVSFEANLSSGPNSRAASGLSGFQRRDEEAAHWAAVDEHNRAPARSLSPGNPVNIRAHEVLQTQQREATAAQEETARAEESSRPARYQVALQRYAATQGQERLAAAAEIVALHDSVPVESQQPKEAWLAAKTVVESTEAKAAKANSQNPRRPAIKIDGHDAYRLSAIADAQIQHYETATLARLREERAETARYEAGANRMANDGRVYSREEDIRASTAVMELGEKVGPKSDIAAFRRDRAFSNASNLLAYAMPQELTDQGVPEERAKTLIAQAKTQVAHATAQQTAAREAEAAARAPVATETQTARPSTQAESMTARAPTGAAAPQTTRQPTQAATMTAPAQARPSQWTPADAGYVREIHGVLGGPPIESINVLGDFTYVRLNTPVSPIVLTHFGADGNARTSAQDPNGFMVPTEQWNQTVQHAAEFKRVPIPEMRLAQPAAVVAPAAVAETQPVHPVAETTAQPPAAKATWAPDDARLRLTQQAARGNPVNIEALQVSSDGRVAIKFEGNPTSPEMLTALGLTNAPRDFSIQDVRSGRTIIMPVATHDIGLTARGVDPAQPAATRAETATPAPAQPHGETNSFGLDVNRREPTQSFSENGVSGARVGKANGTGIVEDNGIGLSGISDQPIDPQAAHQRLENVFNSVRARPFVSEQVAATAATAVTTMDGVVWRGAGDALVVAVGDNGKAVVLNELHTGHGQVVTNVLQPGKPAGAGHTEAGGKSWNELRSTLGANNVRIAVMSDGISNSHDPAGVASDVEHLIQSNNINFSDPDWSQRVLSASADQSYRGYKSDDRVVVSAKTPTVPSEQAMIGAFDGVGSGRSASAEVAHAATQVARQEFSPGRAPVPAPEPAYDAEATIRQRPAAVAPTGQGNERALQSIMQERLGTENIHSVVSRTGADGSRSYVVTTPDNFSRNSFRALGIDPVNINRRNIPGSQFSEVTIAADRLPPALVTEMGARAGNAPEQRRPLAGRPVAAADAGPGDGRRQFRDTTRRGPDAPRERFGNSGHLSGVRTNPPAAAPLDTTAQVPAETARPPVVAPASTPVPPPQSTETNPAARATETAPAQSGKTETAAPPPPPPSPPPVETTTHAPVTPVEPPPVVVEPTTKLATVRAGAIGGATQVLFAYKDLSNIAANATNGHVAEAGKQAVTLGAGVAGGVGGAMIGALPPAGAVIGATLGTTAGYHAGYDVADTTINTTNAAAGWVGGKIDSATGGRISGAGNYLNDKTGGWAGWVAEKTGNVVGAGIRYTAAGVTAVAGGIGGGVAGAIPPVGAAMGGFVGGALATDAANAAMGTGAPSATAALVSNPTQFAVGAAKGMVVDNAMAAAYDVGLTTQRPEGRLPADTPPANAAGNPPAAEPTTQPPPVASMGNYRGNGNRAGQMRATQANTDQTTTAPPAATQTDAGDPADQQRVAAAAQQPQRRAGMSAPGVA